MSLTRKTAMPCAPAPAIEEVEGVVEDCDSSTATFRLRLLDGSEAYLSWYEISDDEYLRTKIGSLIQGRVDRRELNSTGSKHHLVLGAPARLLSE